MEYSCCFAVCRAQNSDEKPWMLEDASLSMCLLLVEDEG